MPPQDSPTHWIPRPGQAGPNDPYAPGPTERIWAQSPGQQRPDRPTDKIYPSQPQHGYPQQGYQPPGTPPGAPATPPAGGKPRKSGLRGPKSIILILVVVVALVFAALAGAELFARWQAAKILNTVADCITQDSADVSFSTTPPFLWQYFNGEYTNISMTTAGNQIREAIGMKADITLKDIKLQDSGDSQGTIGSINAKIEWTSDGIKQTVANNIPLIGSSITKLTTDPSAGTFTIGTDDFDITAKPTVNDGALGLEVEELDGGGFLEGIAQSALDSLADQLKDNYPLGIKVDSVTVTDTGVVGEFSSQDATIPKGDSSDSELDQCFQDL